MTRLAALVAAGFLAASAQVGWAGSATAGETPTDPAVTAEPPAETTTPTDPPTTPTDPPTTPTDPPTTPTDPPTTPTDPPTETPKPDPKPSTPGATGGPTQSPGLPGGPTSGGSTGPPTWGSAAPTYGPSPSPGEPLFRDGLPTRTSDPLALLRGTVENSTPMALTGSPADDAEQTGASSAARPATAVAESSDSASPVSGSIKADDDQLASPASSGPTLLIVLAGVLAALAVMVGAAAWQNWRTDD